MFGVSLGFIRAGDSKHAYYLKPAVRALARPHVCRRLLGDRWSSDWVRASPTVHVPTTVLLGEFLVALLEPPGACARLLLSCKAAVLD